MEKLDHLSKDEAMKVKMMVAFELISSANTMSKEFSDAGVDFAPHQRAMYNAVKSFLDAAAKAADRLTEISRGMVTGTFVADVENDDGDMTRH